MRLWNFILALFFLMMLCGVPGANAGPWRTYPYDFSYTVPAKRMADVPNEVRYNIRESVRQTLQDAAGPTARLNEMAVFSEYSDITTICGWVAINNIRRPFVIQTDRFDMVYFAIDPPTEDIRRAGCLRPIATLSIY